MKILETIKKAIEGGWNPYKLDKDWYWEMVDHDDDFDGYIHFTDTKDGKGKTYHIGMMFLDPSFWKCLGKAMEWGSDTFHEDDGKTYWDYYFHCPICGEIITDLESGCPSECEYDCAEIISWLYEWQKFIAHLANGGTAEGFFKELKL